MNALIIDNYDSFTLNLSHLVAGVIGKMPTIVRNDTVSVGDVLKMDLDFLLISPGPGHPACLDDFGICRDLILHVDLPILGVCLGFQGLASAFGGSIACADEPMHGRISKIRHTGEGLFAGLPQEFDAVRYHSLSVGRDLPAQLRPMAWTPENVLMAISHCERPLWGVQFHPESVGTEFGHELMSNFAECVRDTSRVHIQRAGCGLFASEESPGYAGADLDILPHRVPSQGPAGGPTKLVYRRLAWLDPEKCFSALFADSEKAFWLDSSLPGANEARFSLMGSPDAPGEETVFYSAQDRRITRIRNGMPEQSVSATIFEYLRSRLVETRVESDLPFDFSGGWVGYFGYETRADCGSTVSQASPYPDAAFMLIRRFLAFDHQEQELYLVSLVGEEETEKTAASWMHSIEAMLQDPASAYGFVQNHETDFDLQYSRTREEYLEDVERCQGYIRKGESYEICLTMNAHARTDIDPFLFYQALRRQNPAPYSAFLRFGDLRVACSSPERFLRVKQDGLVESRPVKGTSRRGDNEAEDVALRSALFESAKNRAENLMIVDLLRHDLGTICKPGSVTVPRMMEIESYETVHQLVSTVRGQLRDDADLIDCIQQAFPGGSMTGAPKRRTMEILDHLEPEARGIYSGALGYLGFNGAADLNIVIRSAVFKEGHAQIGMGGAVTSMSSPSEEYDEAVLKGNSVLQVLNTTVPEPLG